MYYVYILASRNRVLYTGVTSDLVRRVWQHKQDVVEGFTRRYRAHALVYFEETEDVKSALQREKQIKGWVRAKKVAMIESVNPRWKDLSAGWYDGNPQRRSG